MEKTRSVQVGKRPWKEVAVSKATNPEYPYMLLKSISDALDRDHPDLDYILQKIEYLKNFCENRANFIESPMQEIIDDARNCEVCGGRPILHQRLCIPKRNGTFVGSKATVTDDGHIHVTMSGRHGAS